MAYGIEVTGVDNSGGYIVTDTAKDLVNYAVVATGTAQSINLTSTQGKRPILMINGNQTANTGKIITTSFAGFSRSFKKLTFSNDQYGNINVTSTTNATIDYILLKDMTGITNASSAGSYGFQVFTAAGEVAVDSRRFLTDTKFLIKAVWPPGTRSGNNGLLSSDPDQYVDSSYFFLFDGGVEGTTGTGALFNPTGGGVSAGIKNYNFLEDISSEGGGGTSNQSSVYFSNFSTIMIGE
jgi:hypothetical protein